MRVTCQINVFLRYFNPLTRPTHGRRAKARRNTKRTLGRSPSGGKHEGSTKPERNTYKLFWHILLEFFFLANIFGKTFWQTFLPALVGKPFGQTFLADFLGNRVATILARCLSKPLFQTVLANTIGKPGWQISPGSILRAYLSGATSLG